MIIVINGKELVLNSLDHGIDNAFIDLYKAYFDNGVLNFDEFNQEVNSYFNTVINSSEKHNAFFNNFTVLWQNILNKRDFGAGELVWERCIDIALDWESKNKGFYIHKGTPFYFWGMTAILRGDIDKGYSLMHKALQEDERTTGKVTPKTPSLAFVIADYSTKEQAFGDWPSRQADYLNNQIQKYNSKYNEKITLDRFWEKIVNSDLDKFIIYQFAYYISKFLDIKRKPRYIYEGNFAAQLLLDTLFNLSRVIVSVIQNRNPSKWKPIDQIAFVNQRGRFNLPKTKLREINKSLNGNFERTLGQIISGNYVFNDGKNISKRGIDFTVTYGIRNYAAHKITSFPIIWQKFEEIETHLMNSLIYVINNLY